MSKVAQEIILDNVLIKIVIISYQNDLKFIKYGSTAKDVWLSSLHWEDFLLFTSVS